MKAVNTFLATMFALLTILVFSNSPIMAAGNDSTVASPTFFTGDRGTFEFRTNENSFVVWRPYDVNKPDGGSYGIVGGIITSTTIVRFVNKPNLTVKDLSLLNGKEVLVWGKFRNKGKGEAQETLVIDISIAVLGINK